MARTYFTVGDIAAHDAHVTYEDGPPWPARGGWTYQDITGSHGTVIYEGPSEADAEKARAEFMKCDAQENGAYCYTHNPHAKRD